VGRKTEQNLKPDVPIPPRSNRENSRQARKCAPEKCLKLPPKRLNIPLLNVCNVWEKIPTSHILWVFSRSDSLAVISKHSPGPIYGFFKTWFGGNLLLIGWFSHGFSTMFGQL